MPQMSPMLWTKMMMLFILMILMMNIIMYFNKNYNIMKLNQKKMKKNIYWKW